jgi:hypothetical protein
MALAVHRPDQSDYVAHFTKANEKRTAMDALIQILSDRTLIASRLPWTNKAAVCFSECPWSSLLGHSERYSPYGIGFRKPRVFAAGGGPVYYVRSDMYEKQQWDDHLHAFVTPFNPYYRPANKKDLLGGKTVDYTHEREWRVPHDFTFDYNQVEFVILDTYNDMAQFPQEMKDAVGRDKFLLMQNYRTIERLWPTHIM